MLTTNQRKPVETPPVKIRALLIDPFKCECFPLLVDWADQADIHKLLDCELIHSIRCHDDLLWVDESGLLREPFVYPQFKIRGVNGDCPLTGYGLITGGWTYKHVTGCSVFTTSLSIIFEEHWPRRINPDQCIDQLLRLYLP